MAPNSRPSPSNNNNSMQVDGEDAEEADDSVPTETIEDFSARIDEEVKKFIDAAMVPDEGIADIEEEGSKPEVYRTQGRGRDSYKDGVVYAERKAVLHEFGRKAYVKCSHCSS